MIKIAALLTLVAVATAAPAVITSGIHPASTGQLTYSTPIGVAQTGPFTVSHGSPVAVAHASPVSVAHGSPVVVSQPGYVSQPAVVTQPGFISQPAVVSQQAVAVPAQVVYTSGARVAQSYVPVQQQGFSVVH